MYHAENEKIDARKKKNKESTKHVKKKMGRKKKG
jgi:hypothetical protein